MKNRFIQNIIDRLRHKIVGLPIMIKKSILIKKDNINTAILGSSHLQCGFIPQANEINLAISSQDLYYAWNIYKLLNPQIKNIIISFSVFTPGHSLIRTHDKNLCILYKLLFNIAYQDNDLAKKYHLTQQEKWYSNEINKYIEKNQISELYNGSPEIDLKSNKDFKDAIVAKKHLKNNLRDNSQMKYCKNIINETQNKHQNLIFIITPVIDNYSRLLPNEKTLFEKLYSIIKEYKHIKVLNYFNSSLFDKNDFIDSHHLNYYGAKKLTNLIRNEIYS